MSNIYSVSMVVDNLYEKYWVFNTQELNNLVNNGKKRKATTILIQDADGNDLAGLTRKNKCLLPAVCGSEDEGSILR